MKKLLSINIDNPRNIVLNKSKMLMLTLLALMFISNDTFLFGTNKIEWMVEIPRVLMAGFIFAEVIYFTVMHKARFSRPLLVIAIIMIGLMIFISFYHGDPLKLIIVKCLCIAGAVCLTCHYDFLEYAETFIKIMLFLAVMALILEVIAYILPGLAYRFPRVTNAANLQITTIGVAGFATQYLSTKIIRSFGIFWEPGVFQIYLNLAIMFELFLKEKVSWRRICVLLGGVFITLSTTGFIVSAWVFVVYFFMYKKEKFTKRTLIIAIGVMMLCVILLGIIATTVIGEIVFDKLTNFRGGSTVARAASIFVNLDIFFDHPFWGVGMDQINIEMPARSYLMYGVSTTHNTNTLLYQFAAHGGIYGGLFMLGTFRFARCLSEKDTARMGLIIAIFLLYIGENLRYSILPFILIFYGYNASKYEHKKMQ